MPKTITNDDGSESEVFTAEELQAQRDAAVEEYKGTNPDKAEELAKALEELEKLKGKDMNFANLRAQKEAADKKVEDILSGVDEKISAAKKEVLEGVMKDHYDEVARRLAAGDKELLAKIELQYKRLGDPAATKEEITRKLGDAFTLAAGGARPETSQAPFSSGGVGRLNLGGGDKKPLAADEADLLKRMAAAGGMKIEDQDLK